MKRYEQEIKNVLTVLNDSGALSHVVLAGSWAMYFYQLIFKDFIPQAETMDLDLYLPNSKKVNGVGFVEKMKSLDYAMHVDYLTGKTTFVSKGGFNIEFLTTPDRTMSNTVKAPGLSVVAEALPKMMLAGWNTVKVDWNGLEVNIVSPVSFVLQKILINNERKPESKKEKDLVAIKYILPFIKSSKKYTKEFEESLSQCPKKWKKIIIQTAKENNIEI